jgi:DNA-binding transcriptional LysR family regulator
LKTTLCWTRLYDFVMTERLSLRKLDYFIAAAETGTMTAAAERLHISQSAISAGLAALERQLGVQLLLRTKSKGLTLTYAGQRFLPAAHALLARSDELRLGMAEVGERPAGELRVGCFTTIAPFLLPGLMESFTLMYPEVVVNFLEGSLIELQEYLLEGRCELALLYDTDIQPGVSYDLLHEAQPHVLLSAGDPLVTHDTIGPADLAGRDMIMFDVPPSQRYFRGVLAELGVAPTVRHRSMNFEMVRCLVARGAGYSLLIQRPVTDLSYEGLPLVTRTLDRRVTPVGVVLARPDGAQLTRRASVFAEFCHERLRAG